MEKLFRKFLESQGIDIIDWEKFKATQLTPADIAQSIVSNYCELKGYNYSDIAQGWNTRKKEVVYCKHLTHFLVSKIHPTMTLTKVAEVCRLGYRQKHHATILHSKRTWSNLMDTDKELAELTKEIHNKVLS